MTEQLRRARVAIAAFFVLNGAALSSWAPRIPRVKADLGLSASVLGLALAATSIGAMGGTVVGGRLSTRVSSRAVTAVAATVLAAALPLVGLAPGAWSLAGVLALLGAADGALDTAMNAQGVELEQDAGRAVLHGLHGWWSVGAGLGALGGTVAAGLGVGVAPHLALTGLVLVALTALAAPSLLPARTDPLAEPATTSAPRGSRWRPLLLLGVTTVVASVPESLPIDWSAVYTREVTGAGPAAAGAAYAAFATAMAVTRFATDRLVDRRGSDTVLRIALPVAVAGFLLAIAVPTPAAAVAGFALVGVGTAPTFPTLFRRAGRADPRGAARGTAVVSGVSRLGFLVLPPVIGFSADAVGLRPALLAGPVALVLLVALLTGRGRAR